jgi:hypothetical protein
MSWEELQVRAGQEIGKRLDVLRHYAGFEAFPNGGVGTSSAAGKFFFTVDELAARIQILKENLPDQVGKIISDANEICDHRFRLLGYENLDYGPTIDWHLDAVHGKRAPLKPWYKIHFLDFEEVGDHKVIWELNRHQHLVILAKAWCLTRQDKYVRELVEQWYHWQRANPYPLGINWASSLEVAFRSLSWLWVRGLLADCPARPANFEEDCLTALAANGRHIERYLSTYFSPNTHLLGEAVALFSIGVLCPQIEAATRWRELGWNILLREAERQVHPDGVYFEPSLYYHVYALDFFLYARLLAERNGIPAPAELEATLNKMLDVVRAISQDAPPNFGDDDGGRVFDPHRNRSEYRKDPLAIGAVLFKREDLRSAAQLTEESVWLLGERALSLAQQKPVEVEGRSVAFTAGGIYVMASGHGQSEQMVIHAGGHEMRNGHGHADALSLTVSFAGQPLLVDPGTFSYISAGNERDVFRATAAHNTLRVDGVDQALPDGPFRWRSFPTCRVDLWLTGNNFSLFSGTHDGYERLAQPVVHRRTVFHLRGRFWLVRDEVLGRGSHDLDFFWHFAPELEVAQTAGGFLAQLGTESNPRMALLLADQPNWNCNIESSFVSPVYGRKDEAAVVRCSAHVNLPADQATLIVPLTGQGGEPGTFSAISQITSACGYEYHEKGCVQQGIFAGSESQPWSLGPWSSDARFLFISVEQDRTTHLIACRVRHLKVGERTVFQRPETVDWLEWHEKDGAEDFSSSDSSADRSFSADALRSQEPLL